MVGQGGTDHTRHRALSVPARFAVAVDREPRELGCERAARGRLGYTPGGCGIGVPALLDRTPTDLVYQ
jgi:hypothetical protein